jgi:hypothetical protein
MRNTVVKKRVRQEDVDSDYLFGNCLQLPGFCSNETPPCKISLWHSEYSDPSLPRAAGLLNGSELMHSLAF